MKSSERPVSEVMSAPVVGLDLHTRVEAALALAGERHAHHFPVLSEQHVVGFVCTCDLEEVPLNGTVGSVMRRPVVTVERSANAGDAARLMAEHGVGSAIVMDGADVYGIVTRRDLERAGGDVSSMLDAACTACGSHRHLRECPDGATLCIDCRTRAREPEWFETGGGD